MPSSGHSLPECPATTIRSSSRACCRSCCSTCSRSASPTATRSSSACTSSGSRTSRRAPCTRRCPGSSARSASPPGSSRPTRARPASTTGPRAAGYEALAAGTAQWSALVELVSRPALPSRPSALERPMTCPTTCNLIDRMRIERVVWSLDQRLYDLPRKTRIERRRELRTNLLDAAARRRHRRGAPRRRRQRHPGRRVPRRRARSRAPPLVDGRRRVPAHHGPAAHVGALRRRRRLRRRDPRRQPDADGTFTWPGIGYLQTEVTYTVSRRRALVRRRRLHAVHLGAPRRRHHPRRPPVASRPGLAPPSRGRPTARRSTDEQGEAAPAPLAVDLHEAGVAHPGELRLDLGEHVLGVAARPLDASVELLLELVGGALHHLEVGEHATRAAGRRRPPRAATASARAARWWMANPETTTSNVPSSGSGCRGRARRAELAARRRTAAGRGRASAPSGRAPIASVASGRASRTTAASLPSPHPRSSTRSTRSGSASTSSTSPACRAASRLTRPTYSSTFSWSCQVWDASVTPSLSHGRRYRRLDRADGGGPMLINVTPSEATDEVEKYLAGADQVVGLPAELRGRVRLAARGGAGVGRAERGDPRRHGPAPLRDRHHRRGPRAPLHVLHRRPREVPAGRLRRRARHGGDRHRRRRRRAGRGGPGRPGLRRPGGARRRVDHARPTSTRSARSVSPTTRSATSCSRRRPAASSRRWPTASAREADHQLGEQFEPAVRDAFVVGRPIAEG